MAQNDIIEFAINATYGGQQVTNVLHFRQQGDDGNGDQAVGLINAFENELLDLWTVCLLSSYTMDSYGVRRVAPTTTQTFYSPTAGAGQRGGTGMPAHSVIMMDTRGLTDRRLGLGRIYFSGLSVEDEAAGRLDGPIWGLFDELGERFQSPIASVGGDWNFQLCIFNRKTKLYSDVADTTTRPRFRTLRSRVARSSYGAEATAAGIMQQTGK